MMHSGPMPESAGEFTSDRQVQSFCRSCDKKTVHKMEVWESSCGGYEDGKFTCLSCQTVHWIDGDDG